MNRSKIIKYSIINSTTAAIYVVLVATFLTNAQSIFGQDSEKSVFIPIAMLMLLVLSASVMGGLIFGRSVYLFVQGEKSEAVRLAIYTIGDFFALTALAFIILFFASR